MTPFYALIYTLAYSESNTVAQQPSHTHMYISQLFSITAVTQKLSKH